MWMVMATSKQISFALWFEWYSLWRWFCVSIYDCYVAVHLRFVWCVLEWHFGRCWHNLHKWHKFVGTDQNDEIRHKSAYTQKGRGNWRGSERERRQTLVCLCNQHNLTCGSHTWNHLFLLFDKWQSINCCTIDSTLITLIHSMRWYKCILLLFLHWCNMYALSI